MALSFCKVVLRKTDLCVQKNIFIYAIHLLLGGAGIKADEGGGAYITHKKSERYI
jgi:hypothetical protein